MGEKLYAVEVGELEVEHNNQTQEDVIRVGASAVCMTVENDVEEAKKYVKNLMCTTTNCELWECTDAHAADDVFIIQPDCQNGRLFGVKIFKVEQDDKEQIADHTFVFVIADEVITAQQLAIQYQKEKTGDSLWNVAEGTPIENVEGWLVNPCIEDNKWKIKLEPSVKLESFSRLKAEKKIAMAVEKK